MKLSAMLYKVAAKRQILMITFALIMIFSPVRAMAATTENEKYASIVIDAESHQVLHSRFADSPRYPASLTKVMTLYMVFDALDSGELTLDEALPVSLKASQASPSKLGLSPGSTIKVEDAILALVTKSANDVARVVAERLGGSESRFSALMTVKARALGMQDTRFYNASGLPDTRQVTTARDMATLAMRMMEDHKPYYQYFSTQAFTWKGSSYANHNKLLGQVVGVDGVKTGYTRASGFNLMASAKREDTRVIAVMMGGKSSRSRNDHVTELLEAAFTAIEATDLEEPDLRTRLAFDEIHNPEGGATGIQTISGEVEQGSAE